MDFAAGDLEVVPEAAADLVAEAPREAEEEPGFERTELQATPAKTTGEGPRATLVVEGRVVDGTGRPVADAEVNLFMRRGLQSLFREGEPFPRGGQAARQRFALQRVPKTVTTGRDGKYAFSGAAFEETTVEVGVRHARFAPEVARREWQAKDGKLLLEDIVLEAGGKVIGTVVDKAGAPLAGAEVRYTMGFEDMGMGRGGRGGRGGPGGPNGFMAMLDRTIEQLLPVAKTDGGGAFELTNVPSGAFRLRAEASKKIPTTTPQLELKPEETKSAGNIVLEQGAELTGVVRDAQGQPVADAEVRATGSRAALGDLMQNAIQNLGPMINEITGNGGAAPGAGGNQGREQRGRMMEDARRQLGGMFGQERRTKTDAKGEFGLDCLPLVALRLEVTHEKFCNETKEPIEPAKTPRVELTLHARLSVSGVVFDEMNNKPVESFGIRARRMPGGDGRGPLADFGLNRGNVRDLVDQARAQLGQAEVAVRGRRGGQNPGAEAGNPGQTNEQGRQGRQGRGERQPTVQDEAEAAQREAQREARRQREEAYRKERLGASGVSPGPAPAPSAHPEGRFVVDGLEPGTYVFDIDAPGYARVAAGPVSLERDKAVAPVSFRLARGSNVSGRVVTQRGSKPIGGARVELLLPPLEAEAAPRGQMPFGPMGQGGPGGQGPGRGGRGGGTRLGDTKTGEDGTFLITGLRPGTVQVRVTADGYVTGKPLDVVVPAGRDASGVVVTLGQGSRLFGTVRNLPAGETTVRAQHIEGDQANTRVGANGSYELKGLKPGGWFVTVEGRGQDEDFGRMIALQFARQIAGGNPDVVLAEGGETRLDLDASHDELCTVRGIVFKNGLPAGDIEVSLQMPDAPGSTQATPGNFDLERMARRMSGRLLRDATDDKGAFQIQNVPAGTYDVELRVRRGGGGGRGGGPFGGGGGSPLLREKVVLSEGQTFTRDYQIRTAEIRLEVVGADGQPLGRGRVSLVLANEAGDRTPDKWNDLPSMRRLGLRDGAAASGDILPGDYLYEVASNGLKTVTGRISVASGSPATTRVQLQAAEPTPEKK